MARFSKVRAGAFLPVTAGEPDRIVQPALPTIPAQLWLCLYLPQLPLEAQVEAQVSQSGQVHEEPLAICEEQGRRTLIVTVNPVAAARGVRVRMPVNSALALVPELVVKARNVPLESATLARLATWAGRFTPAVSITSGNSLLLEIQRSLRLFNGLDALQATVTQGLRVLGHQVHMACTPTPRASLWLARAGSRQPVQTSLELRQALAGIQVGHLGWPARTVQMLLQMGLTTVGDCARLPREGFARRLGPVHLRELDQAYGRCPDPQRLHVPPVRFAAELELAGETIDASLLLDGFQQLFQSLNQALESHQASVRILWCQLTHPGGQATRLRLGLHRAAGHSASLLHGLLRLRLEALLLPAMVISLSVQADLLPGQVPVGTDLLGQHMQTDGGLHTLLERLRARLGGQAVQGFALRAEHRPETAWRAVADPLEEPRASETLIPSRSRPVWLLPAPAPLGVVADQPAWHGALTLERGPERIESGWWDGGDIRRDYYRASNPQGAMLWVYRDLRSQVWYLQGIFG